MNCEEVSKHLTDYLDKSLDTAMTTRVATHVIACSHCRAETNEIADCIEQVAGFPALDPPLGFAQRIMANVHEMEPKLSLWQRLIAPLTSRVPMQAGALAIIAIFAVVLYQKESPLQQINDVNLALRNESKTAVKEKALAPAGGAAVAALEDRQITAKKTTTTSAPAEAARAAEPETSRRAVTTPAQPPQALAAAPTAARSEIESSNAEEKSLAPKRPPLRVQEVTTARDNIPMIGESRGFGAPLSAAPLGALRQSSARPTPTALERATPIGDRVADFEFTVRRRSPQRRDHAESLSSTDTLQKSNEADNSSLAASRPSTPPARAKIESIAEIRFYNVAPEHFEVFKKELATEANIESEPKVSAKEIDAAKQADRQLLVKVTILPADHAPPSR